MIEKNTLFIIAKPHTQQPLLGSKIAQGDALLLRGDACYNAQQFTGYAVPVYALQTDVAARGAEANTQGVSLIDDQQWVALTLEYSRLISE